MAHPLGNNHVYTIRPYTVIIIMQCCIRGAHRIDVYINRYISILSLGPLNKLISRPYVMFFKSTSRLEGVTAKTSVAQKDFLIKNTYGFALIALESPYTRTTVHEDEHRMFEREITSLPRQMLNYFPQLSTITSTGRTPS